jgi:S-adenosylmethionine synthetase
MPEKEKLYTNEIVFRGHPDKMCDQFSAAILDECLKQDPKTHAGIECMAKNDRVFVCGELTTGAKIDITAIVNRVAHDIGYDNEFKVETELSLQSQDINQGVSKEDEGAGDNGMMFGYACSDTAEMLPPAMVILQKFAKGYDELIQAQKRLGRNGPFRPDGKAEITGIYDDDFRLVAIKEFTVCYCNDEQNRALTDSILKRLAEKCAGECKIERIQFNPTGRFEKGGPWADCGLTGRKIVVDAYQSFANVGGGNFNGKDPSKVDISGAYKAREIAKKYVKEYGLRWCEVQISYAIGQALPLAVYIDSNLGTFAPTSEEIASCKPAAIIRDLEMLKPDYEEKAKFGHFQN